MNITKTQCSHFVELEICMSLPVREANPTTDSNCWLHLKWRNNVQCQIDFEGAIRSWESCWIRSFPTWKSIRSASRPLSTYSVGCFFPLCDQKVCLSFREHGCWPRSQHPAVKTQAARQPEMNIIASTSSLQQREAWVSDLYSQILALPIKHFLSACTENASPTLTAIGSLGGVTHNFIFCGQAL